MRKKQNPVEELLELITLDEAADLRGVTRAAISYLVQKKRIRSTKMFGRVLVYRNEVLSYKPDKGGRPSTVGKIAGVSISLKKRRGKR